MSEREIPFFSAAAARSSYSYFFLDMPNPVYVFSLIPLSSPVIPRFKMYLEYPDALMPAVLVSYSMRNVKRSSSSAAQMHEIFTAGRDFFMMIGV